MSHRRKSIVLWGLIDLLINIFINNKLMTENLNSKQILFAFD